MKHPLGPCQITRYTHYLLITACLLFITFVNPFRSAIIFGLVEWNERRLDRRCLKIPFLWHLIQRRFITECRPFGKCIFHIFKAENIKEESTLYRTFEAHLTKRKFKNQKKEIPLRMPQDSLRSICIDYCPNGNTKRKMICWFFCVRPKS
jgi:hypothetical protein